MDMVWQFFPVGVWPRILRQGGSFFIGRISVGFEFYLSNLIIALGRGDTNHPDVSRA